MTQTLLPVAQPLPQDWAVFPSGRSDDAVDETVPDGDATYIYSGTEGAQVQLGLATGSAPGVLDRHVIRYYHRAYADAGTATIADSEVALLEGATVIATRTMSTPTATYAIEELELTQAEADAITAYSNLRIRFTCGEVVLAGGATVGQHRVTAAHLQIPDVGSIIGSLDMALALTMGEPEVGRMSGSVLLDLALSGSGTNPNAPDVFYPHPDYDWISYLSPTCGVPDHPILRFALFQSASAQPAGERAAVVWIPGGILQNAQMPDEISAASHPELHALLSAGYDVYFLAVPPCRGGSSPNDTSDVDFDLTQSPQHLGDPYTGNGVTWDILSPTPTGEATHPLEQPEWLMPVKCIAMFTQWLADGNGEAAGTDMERIGIGGESSGIGEGLQVYYGRNYAPYMFPSGTGQDAVSTRDVYKFALVHHTQVWYFIFSQTAPPAALKFATDADPDVPGTNLGDAPVTAVRQGSALFDLENPIHAAENRLKPIYCTTTQLGTGLPPYTINNTTPSETNVHGAWAQNALKTSAGDACEYVARSQAVFNQGLADRLIVDTADWLEHEIAWLNALLEYNPTPPPMTGTIGTAVALTGNLQSSGPGWVESIHAAIRTTVDELVALPSSLPVQYDNAEEIAPRAPSGESYQFGALYEPPEGMVIQGLGQWPIPNGTYIATLGGATLPASHCTNFNVGTSTHPIPSQAQMVARLEAIWDAGAFPNVGIEFRDQAGDGHGMDTEVATTSDLDFIIDRIGDALAEFDRPCIVATGWECNSTSPGYHVADFVDAWLKVRTRILARIATAGKTSKVAWAWGPEASFGQSWDQWNPEITSPGSVDWFCIDVFKKTSYLTEGQNAYENLVEFCDVYAPLHSKPVLMREVQAVGADIPPDGTIEFSADPEDQDGIDVWEHWFDDPTGRIGFFEFVEDHPTVKLFHYDGTVNSFPSAPADWLDSRLDRNEAVRTRYVERVSDGDTFVSADQLSLLNGFSEAIGVEPPTVESTARARLRVHVTHDETDQIATSGVQRTFRRTGEVEVEIRVAPTSGDNLAYGIADDIVEALRELTAPPVIFGAPRVTPATKEGDWWILTVAVPWRSDLVEARPTSIGGTQTTTLDGLTDVLRARFDDTFGPDGLDLPVQYDNSATSPAADASSEPWVRLTVLPGQSERVSGGTWSRFRTPGLAVASVFVPLDSGEQAALEIVDTIEELFRGVSEAGVVMEAAHLTVVGQSEAGDSGRGLGGAFWQLNVKVPFLIDTPGS